MTAATATEITMPRLSDSMEEGTILAWLVAAGEPVAAGQELLEIETDKATMTVEAEAAGTLEILAPEGTTLAVGEPIARLGTGGTPPPQPAAEPRQAPEPPSPQASAPATTTSAANGARPATPLARRVAGIHGVALDSIAAGSGVGGRVVKADVLAAAGVAEPAAAVAPPQASLPPRSTDGQEGSPAVEGAKGGTRTVEPSRLQAVIARRMSEAKATAPHFQVETEVRMDAAIELRSGLKAIAGEEPVPSFNDLIVRATALALRQHPKANGSYRDGNFELHDRVNVGIAVAAEDALVVPTIFDADRMSLGEIGRESRRLAERVRAGTVTPPELAGGTFTVSNLGMFGMTAIYPVINLPQAAILGVGKTRQVLARGEDGGIEDAALMTLTLSCDHRILYGAEAARFLGEVRDLLEAPLRVAL
ncbi:MAG TPA: dihydrolipoamide acetyltransferase family protein [Solirubrobacterales bacterium]|jgi:pyruvate dehydrogenase E2 component (dihydrolipoamide acetyltransferase)